MALQSSGAISFNNINVELGVAGTTQASLNQSSYRTLAGVASGAISMSNFYGKSAGTPVSITYTSMYYSDREGGSTQFLVFDNLNEAVSRPLFGANIIYVQLTWDNPRQEISHFEFGVRGVRAQNFFNSVSGNGRTLYTNSLSYFNSQASGYYGALSAWVWNYYVGPSPLPFTLTVNETLTNTLTFA